MTDKKVRNWDGTDLGIEVPLGLLGRDLSPEEFAEIIESYVNVYGHEFRTCKKIGEILTNNHLTIQRSVIVFAFGIIAGMSTTKMVDPRNAEAVEAAKKITEMLENGEISLGAFL